MGIPAAHGVSASGKPPAGDWANAVLASTIGAVGPTQPFAFRGPMNLAIWASMKSALTTTALSLTASVASGSGLATGDAINSTLVPAGTTMGVLSGTTVTLAPPPMTLRGTVNTNEAVIRDLVTTDGLLGATVTGPGIPAGTTILAIVTAAVGPTDLSPGTRGVVSLSNTPTSAPTSPLPQAFTLAVTGNAILASGTDSNATYTGAAVTFNATVQLERSFDGCQTWIVCNIGGSGILAQWTGATVTPVSLTFGEPEKNVLYRLNCTVYSSGVINYRISQTGGAAESLAIGPLSGG